MKNLIVLALLSLAGPASAQTITQTFTAPDGVNKCSNSGVTAQCTLLGTAPINVVSSASVLKCEDGYEIVVATRGYMCAKDLKVPK